jgi:CTP synthase
LTVRKLVIVTGGVLSGLGKGVVAASVALLFQSKGYRVSLQKIDPYVNLDAGTMNPYEHGEVFVTDDGKETDLDVGRYERFLNRSLSAANYMTTGQVYWSVIRQERAGVFLGQTVQVIPHITDEIKSLIHRPIDRDEAEIGVVEVGGTVGDIEGLPFLESLRQLRDELPREDMCFVHVTLLPRLSTTEELKTKPTQHSVKELRGIGIQPHVIVARSEQPIPEPVRRKLSLFCDVPLDCVIENVDQRSIYEVPLVFQRHALDDRIERQLGLAARPVDLAAWEGLTARVRDPARRTTVGIVGKYVELHDAYLSIREALLHAGASLDTGVDIRWISAERVDRDGPATSLEGLDGILIPGGFGDRGVEGKVEAVRFAREHGVPYFGICLGLQCAVVEFARTVLGMEDANSSEFDETTAHPVIDLLENQVGVDDRGGTMRRGASPVELREDSLAHRLYGRPTIEERHRHRYEVNPVFRDRFEQAGMIVTGSTSEGLLAEVVEIPDHPWFVGVQFHPEFRSRFVSPHPLFRGFVQACAERSG